MQKKEAKFQTLFNHWLRANIKTLKGSGFAFELKDTRGKQYLSWDAVKSHQAAYLMAASGKGIIYKISDQSRGYKPFDCFMLKNAKSFVVINYPDFFCLIEIDLFVEARSVSEAKSLTAPEARQIASLVISKAQVGAQARASLRRSTNVARR